MKCVRCIIKYVLYQKKGLPLSSFDVQYHPSQTFQWSAVYSNLCCRQWSYAPVLAQIDSSKTYQNQLDSLLKSLRIDYLLTLYPFFGHRKRHRRHRLVNGHEAMLLFNALNAVVTVVLPLLLLLLPCWLFFFYLINVSIFRVTLLQTNRCEMSFLHSFEESRKCNWELLAFNWMHYKYRIMGEKMGNHLFYLDKEMNKRFA